MCKLMLVRHSIPEIVPEIPAKQWLLSEEGRERCKRLARELAAHEPDVVVSSEEPKATETGEIIARLLGKPFETAAALHEHERSNVGFSDQAQFVASVARLFAEPEALVMGSETARHAERRFSEAVAGVIARHPGGNVVIVAHGTVITLYVAKVAGVEPFPFWQGLGLPSYVLLGLPSLELLHVVREV